MRLRQIAGVSRWNLARRIFALTSPMLLLVSVNRSFAQEQQMMMVRIAEIRVDEDRLEQYKAILQEEAEASVKSEPGVIAIFPMYRKEGDSEFRILEIYADRAAYESHLKAPHFEKYKSSTQHMVKSLKLIDMQAIDAATMKRIFTKMQSR
jgi:quinol monooxygenase YgiN